MLCIYVVCVWIGVRVCFVNDAECVCVWGGGGGGGGRGEGSIPREVILLMLLST